MIRSLRSEFLKLVTIRVPWYLIASASALTALVAYFTATRAGADHMAIPPLNTLAGQTRVFTTSQFGLLFAMVLGVIVAAGEFHHGTATPTYLAEPRRWRVLVAKLAAGGTVGAVYGALAAGIATTVGLAVTASKGYALLVPTGTLVQWIAGAALGAALLVALGIGIGMLVRSQVAGVVGVLLWGLFAERIITALYSSVGPYLPYTAATTLAGQPFDRGLVGVANALSFGPAALVVAGVAAALCLVASQSTMKADIA